MQGNIIVASAGQAAAPTLGELANKIRKAHAGVVAALSSALEQAISAGTFLVHAKKLAGHGRWTEFVRACDINERTARRYMQLAELATNRSWTTDLVGTSIEGAIRCLAPPRANSSPMSPVKHVIRSERSKPEEPGANRQRVTHLDLLALWDKAPLEERTRAISNIGLRPLLATMPEDWIPLIEKWIADRRQPSVPAASVDPDLSIPPFLRRALAAKSETTS